MEITFLIVVIVVALIFEYINGFHDSANAIATVVSTRVLSPRQAVAFGAVLNLAGAFAGTHVAKTIGAGIVEAKGVTQIVILCALAAAIVWDLITWYYGIPSSSSHALIGGLIGASIAKSGAGVVNITGVAGKVIAPMVTSPVIGSMVGFGCMLGLLWLVQRWAPERVNRYFRRFQLVSSGIMAFSHGSNDAQKTMGIITLSLFAHGALGSVEVPIWVIALCAATMALGTLGGGWRIIRTMGTKIIRLEPIHGFAAETSAASVILAASHFGIPVSTTHVISTSIMGVGATGRLSAMRWGIAGNIVLAWVLTIPVCMAIASAIYLVVDKIVF